MTRLILAAGVAALAITAPAASAPGGKGGKGGNEQHAKAQRGGGNGQQGRAQRPGRAQAIQMRQSSPRAFAQQARKAEHWQKAQRGQANNVQRFRGPERRQAFAGQMKARKADRALMAQQRHSVRPERIDMRSARAFAQRQTRVERIANPRDRNLARLAETRPVNAAQWQDLARGGVWLDGCPPGLAKKPVACVPPGQAKRLIGEPVSVLQRQVALAQLPQLLRSAYQDTPDYYYRYGNGYMYQVNRADNLVRALTPLFGLGYTVGQQFPSSYSDYYMPTGLQPFYQDTPYTSYRYANGYVYQVDPVTGLIEGVDPLLGYGYGYGQMLPVTYSAYNVPYQYRPLYQDTSSSYYRYAPGAIYQVDPTTSLITAVAALLTGGLTVGQPLPTGYSAYNVPYAYRTSYYDTPDAMYRYANGNIYQVDPATQLVTAIVASVLT